MFRQNCLMGKDLYVRNNGACGELMMNAFPAV